MSTGGAVGGMVAVIAAKKREEIFERFRQRGATSAVTALSLEDLGLSRRPLFELQVHKGAIVKATDDRYYLDEGVVARQQRVRRCLLLALLVAGAAVLLAVWLSS